MSYKVLIPQDVTSPGKDLLALKGYEVCVTGRTDIDSLCEDVRDCDAILARLCSYPEAVFKAGTKLKVLARHGSGYSNVDVEAATRAGVRVCITPTAPANAVAEHTMMLLLACVRQLILQDRGAKLGDWSFRSGLRSTELRGKTLGIIGFGSIGRLVAQKAHNGFGMNIIAFGRHAPEDMPDYVTHTTCLDEELAKSDVISVHLPATPDTHKLFDRTTFSKMRPGAIFLNTSRGDLVDEGALYEALQSKHIFMAGLDVLENETNAGNSPLTQLDSVIITPHSAALTCEALDQMSLLAAMEIHRVLSGQEPYWPVNLL